MIPLTLAQVAAIAGGELVAEPGAATDEVTSVVIDSRQVVDGALFVALAGERVDGHDFAAAAVAAGAAGVLAERPVPAPSVVVADGATALARLARHVIDALGVPVIGVTGSSGKTSTKDVLGQVLARLGPTVAPEGSLNNELGLPLTALRSDASTRYLVLEMSARGVGHIAALCATAPPQVGVVLNVGSAHVGEFGSREAIAAAKSELVAALPSTGLAVLNADDQVVAAMSLLTPARCVLVGVDPGADYRATDVSMVDGRAHFTLVTPGGSALVQLAAYGRHHVGNALAVAAVADWAGLDAAQIAEALAAAAPLSRWRMEVSRTAAGTTVVNDAYNANPESMVAALQGLVDLAAGRPTCAVLGEMAELGPETADAHAEVGRACARLGVGRLVTVGEVARLTAAAAREAGMGVEQVDEVADVPGALAILSGALSPEAVVLVKASRAAGLERVALALLPDGDEEVAP